MSGLNHVVLIGVPGESYGDFDNGFGSEEAPF